MRKASWPRFPLQPMSQAAVPKLFRRRRSRGMTWALLLCGLAFVHCVGPSFSCLGGRKLARTRIHVIAFHLRMAHPSLKKCQSRITTGFSLVAGLTFWLPILSICKLDPFRTGCFAGALTSELDGSRSEQEKRRTWAA